MKDKCHGSEMQDMKKQAEDFFDGVPQEREIKPSNKNPFKDINLVQQAIQETCDEIKKMLLTKNESYGNSVFDPERIFAKGLTVKQMIAVRIDDKLSRLKKGNEFIGDNDTLDLIGYLILDLVRQKLSIE